MRLRSAAYLRAKEVGALFGVPGSHVAALAVAAASTGMALESWGTAFGQVPQTLNGPPVQVQPYVPEPGVSLITINPGSPNPLPIADAAASGGNDTGNGGDGGANAGNDSGDGGDVTTVGGSGNVGSNTALATMLGTAWGATAVANAQTRKRSASTPLRWPQRAFWRAAARTPGGRARKAYSKCILPLSTRAYKPRLRPIRRWHCR